MFRASPHPDALTAAPLCVAPHGALAQKHKAWQLWGSYGDGSIKSAHMQQHCIGLHKQPPRRASFRVIYMEARGSPAPTSSHHYSGRSGERIAPVPLFGYKNKALWLSISGQRRLDLNPPLTIKRKVTDGIPHHLCKEPQLHPIKDRSSPPLVRPTAPERTDGLVIFTLLDVFPKSPRQ